MNSIFLNEENKLYFREGKITYLRPLLESDLKVEYLSWLNNPELNKYSDSFRTFPTFENDLKVFLSNYQKDSNNIVFAMCCKKTGTHFGNCSLNNIDWINRRAQFNINIGIAKYRALHFLDVLSIIAEYSFNTLNLNKITGGAENIDLLKLHERLGWNKEGVLANHIYRNGEYHDVVIFALLRKKYLELKK
jgi:RimJ/RimL family protein N-acetyltransferase